MGELAKTEAGRARISAATERLDRTVGELGERFRQDIPQGESSASVPAPVEHHPPEDRPHQFIPIPASLQNHRMMQEDMNESRVVLPPADEPGQGETHDEFAVEEQGNDQQEMDIGTVSQDPEEDMRQLMNVLTRDARKEVKNCNEEILRLVSALGGSTHRYKREQRKGIRAVVSEIYSPPRVTKATKLLPELNVIPGFALDLTTADSDGRLWDFDEKEMRDRALKKVREEKPMLLVGSPMCTAFSTWQRINDLIRDPYVVKNEKARAVQHLEFCIQLYQEQRRHGRYFLHEHPAYASSWQEETMKNMLKENHVVTATCDQCMYGSEAADGSPIKKPTTFMTNAPELAAELNTRCQGRGGACSRNAGGVHAQCRGETARMAAIYHFKLCRAILRGFRKQLQRDGVCRDGFIGMLDARLEEDTVPVFSISGEKIRDVAYVKIEEEATYRDDITGQPLDPELVRAARAKELEYFESKRVWVKRPLEEARRRTGKPPVTVRWVDTNKGDDINPNVRSRLVARQIRQAGEEAIFAPTPPLEALRSVISYASTDFGGRAPPVRDPESEQRMQISAIDISRAYFNASTDGSDPTYVMLPPEHEDHAKGKCGMLLKHMYGTRAAADGWQQEYSGFLKSIGFTQGAASPCVFMHAGKGIAMSVHGDDFTSAGSKVALDWLEAQLRSKYELREGGRLGPGASDAKELTILNRVIRWTSSGIEYEADPRQAERLLEGLQLDSGCKATATPGIRSLPEQLNEDELLPEDSVTGFRALAARSNYLAADRIDLQFAAKEICRFMSAPTETSAAAMKRLGRYLLGHQRLVYRFPWQQASSIDVYGDTDWAGCPRTRKSTSGGCIMVGSHCIRTWSSTQPSVTLSSGEAEFYGLVKAAGAGLGQQSLMQDLGIELPVHVWTDSSAALGIATRSGLGKLRHLETHTLWVQEKVRTKAIIVRKVRGDVNPADLFTKHLPSKDKIHQLTKLFGCEYRSGRAESAPLLRPKVVGGRQDGHPSNDAAAPVHALAEPEVHDVCRLPHMHTVEEIERHFPKIDAAPERQSSADWHPGREEENGRASASEANVEGRRLTAVKVRNGRRSN